MKRVLIGIAVFLVVAGSGMFAFRGQLVEAATNQITKKMFIERDTDSYDPGIAVGQVFPAIRAHYQDREVASIGEFMGARGMVIYVNRSVDW